MCVSPRCAYNSPKERFASFDIGWNATNFVGQVNINKQRNALK